MYLVVSVVYPDYEVRLTLEDTSIDSENEPIAYLQKRWLFNETQFPLRFQRDNGFHDWQFKKDGVWHSLNMTEIGNHVDVNYVPDDSHRY